MTTPIGRLDVLVGYELALSLVAVLQVGLAIAVSSWLGMHLAGSIWWLVVVAYFDSLLGVALGLLASAFAHTEFQAVQFMPVVVLPQLLLCGLFHPRAQMATALRWASDVLPLSYAVSALQRIAGSHSVNGAFGRDLAVVGGCAVLALGLAAATLRRRSA